MKLTLTILSLFSLISIAGYKHVNCVSQPIDTGFSKVDGDLYKKTYSKMKLSASFELSSNKQSMLDITLTKMNGSKAYESFASTDKGTHSLAELWNNVDEEIKYVFYPTVTSSYMSVPTQAYYGVIAPLELSEKFDIYIIEYEQLPKSYGPNYHLESLHETLNNGFVKLECRS